MNAESIGIAFTLIAVITVAIELSILRAGRIVMAAKKDADMNPGLTEEGGKVISHTVDALKSQPVTLAMILMNVIFVAAIFWGVKGTREQMHEVMKSILEQNTQAQELLSKCIVPPK